MVLDLLGLHFPATDRVALLAICPKLAAMNVSMAFRAQMADIRENWFGVTLGAGNTLVQPAQGEARRVVVKFRDGSDRLPTVERVTVLAGDIQRPMRASGGEHGLRLRLIGRRLLSCCRHNRQRRRHQHQVEPDSRAQGSLPHKFDCSPLNEEQLKH